MTPWLRPPALCAAPGPSASSTTSPPARSPGTASSATTAGDDPKTTAPKLALLSIGVPIGLLGLGILVAAIALDHAIKRAGWG